MQATDSAHDDADDDACSFACDNFAMHLYKGEHGEDFVGINGTVAAWVKVNTGRRRVPK